MSRNLRGLLLTLGSVVLLLAAFMTGGAWLNQSSQAQQAKKPGPQVLTRYEVRIVTSQTREGLAAEANKMGEEGWTVVGVFIDDKGYASSYTAYLQRAKP